MRLKEDNSSWRSGGIKRRMYRQAPLTPDQETIKGHPKRKQKKVKTKPRCKHAWVEVSYQEYYDQKYGWWLWDNHEHNRTNFTMYFICSGCLETKQKTDKGKMRSYYRKRRK